MRTKQTNPFEDKTDKPLMRTKQTNPFENKRDKPLLSKKETPLAKERIGKGVCLFNIKKTKKRTSNEQLRSTKNILEIKFVIILFRTKRIIFF